MITYKELLSTPEYWTTRIQLELFTLMEQYMQTHQLSRTELAHQLGVSKGYISQVLNGDFDHRLSKLVELSMAIGMVPQIKYIPTDKLFDKESTIGININNIPVPNNSFSDQAMVFDDETKLHFSKICDQDFVYKTNFKLNAA